MRSVTFDEFKAQAFADGFDEVLERTWPADAIQIPQNGHCHGQPENLANFQIAA